MTGEYIYIYIYIYIEANGQYTFKRLVIMLYLPLENKKWARCRYTQNLYTFYSVNI